MDWEFVAISLYLWVDPSGRSWGISPASPSLVGAARQVLTYHFRKKLWNDAAADVGEPLGIAPDLVPYNQLRKEYRKEKLARHQYYLDAVDQGAMYAHTAVHLKGRRIADIASKLSMKTAHGSTP